VRHIMVERQREIGDKGHVIAEGRDIGTVVFPGASTKIYLDADPHQRACRRAEELKLKGACASLEEVQQDLKTRDQKDFNRSVGPLKVADDAVVVDTTCLSIDQVVSRVIDIIKYDG
jgi:CMP/dCMP kinase